MSKASEEALRRCPEIDTSAGGVISQSYAERYAMRRSVFVEGAQWQAEQPLTDMQSGGAERLGRARVNLAVDIAAAHKKHGDMSIAVLPADHPDWLKILVEEVGEVAHELTYDVQSDPYRLAGELRQVAAVAACWAAALEVSPKAVSSE